MLKVYLFAYFEISFFMSMTDPVITMYYIPLVSVQILSVVDMMKLGLRCLVQGTTVSEKWMMWYHHRFTKIVVVDCFLFTVFSLIGEDYPAVRFGGIAITSNVTTLLLDSVVTNMINTMYKGEEITKVDNKSKFAATVGALLGSVILAINPTIIDVGWAVNLQVASVFLYGMGCYYYWRRYNSMKKAK